MSALHQHDVQAEHQADAAELGCDEVEALLPLVADGALDADDDPLLFEHLGRCADCQRSLAVHDLVELAIGQGQRAPSTPLGWRRLGRTALAASLLGAAALGYGVWHVSDYLLSPAAPVPVDNQVVDVRIGPDGMPQLRLRHDGELRDIQQIDGRAQRSSELPTVAGPRLAVPATLPRESR